MKTGKLLSDYSPDTFLKIIKNDDGDIIVTKCGKDEFRIATSGSRISAPRKSGILGLFEQLIDAFNNENEEEADPLRWKIAYDDYGNYYVCPKCNRSASGIDYDFCPHCGIRLFPPKGGG
jgi:rubrerythrin